MNPKGHIIQTQCGAYFFYCRYKINKLAYLTVLLFALFSTLSAATGDITTIAGTGTLGYSGDGGPAVSARLYYPYYIAVDSANNIYFSDSYNNRIREIIAGSNNITTVAGNGTQGYSGDGGPAVSAELYTPTGVCLDANNNLYIADCQNHCVRKVDAVTGIISTVAGIPNVGGYNGDDIPAISAELQNPHGVFMSCSGQLYIADRNNLRIRMVDTDGTIYTVAGNGSAGYSGDGGDAVDTALGWTEDVWVDGSDNVYFPVSMNGFRVCRVDAVTGIITTLAGNGSDAYFGDGGPASSASLEYPLSVIGSCSNEFFIATADDNRIRKVDAYGNITTIADTTGTAGYSGDNGPAVSAQLSWPSGVGIDNFGNLLICDNHNQVIRQVQGITCLSSCNTPTITPTVTITLTECLICSPTTTPTSTPTFSITPTITPTMTITNTPSVTPTSCIGEGSASVNPALVRSGSTGNTLIFTYTAGPIAWATGTGYGTLIITIPPVWSPPSTTATDPGYFSITVTGGVLVGSSVSGNEIIVEASGLTANAGQIIVTYGDKSNGGPGATAPTNTQCHLLFATFQVESSPDSSAICPIVLSPQVNISCWIVFTPNTQTPIVSPSITKTITGTATQTNTMTTTPTYTATIIPGPTPCFITVWGSSGNGNSQFNNPEGAAAESSGNVYVADSYNNRIEEFSSTGTYITQWGFSGTSNGQFNYPVAVAVNSSGDVYVSDANNNRIQEFSSIGTYITQWGVTGTGNGQFNSPFGIAVDSSGNVFVVDNGNNRIQEFSSTGAYIIQWGSNGSGNGQFIGPWGIAVNSSGDVYISDPNNSRIQEFSSTGAYITQWGSNGSGEGQFYYGPAGIAIDSSGNVYAADVSNIRIQEFSSTGTYITQWGSYGTGPGQFKWPFGLAVNSSGDVYVSDSDNNNIQEFGACVSPTQTLSLTLTQTQTCTSTPILSPTNTFTITLTYTATLTSGPTPCFITAWGSSGSGNGQFKYPAFLAIDSSGNVYVADEGNNRIEKFSSTGTYITQWGGTGSGNGQFDGPVGVAVDSSGNVYVSDLVNDRIEVFNNTGAYITQWGTAGSGNGQFNDPQGVAVDGSGDVYVADYVNNRIEEFNNTGTYITQWGTAGSGNGQFSGPDGIAIDSSGNVYVTDYGNYRVQEFNSIGTYITRLGSEGTNPGQFSITQDAAIDSSGNVYVTEWNSNRIDEFSSTGTYITRWGSGGSGNGQFNGPSGIAVSSSGNVYVADTNNNRIQEFGACASPTPTLSATPSITPTITATSTFTPTASLTPTLTLTYTVTRTVTSTLTQVLATLTPTITATTTPYPIGDIIVYPNPYNPNKAIEGALKIVNLPIGANISIYTISGELVISMTSQTPVVYWKGRNLFNSPVSSGVYYYVIESGSNNILKTGTIFVVH